MPIEDLTPAEKKLWNSINAVPPEDRGTEEPLSNMFIEAIQADDHMRVDDLLEQLEAYGEGDCIDM